MALKSFKTDTLNTVAAVPPEGGLVHIETVSIGSGVSSVSVNDVFSADYKNYYVVCGLKGSGAFSNNVRLRSGGTDTSTSTYVMQFISGGLSVNSASSTTTTSWGVGNHDTQAEFVMVMNLNNPFEAVTTSIWGLGGRSTNQTSTTGYQTGATSFDGFTVIPTGGTYQGGSIRVYGLKD
jgi:hypothetical protein